MRISLVWLTETAFYHHRAGLSYDHQKETGCQEVSLQVWLQGYSPQQQPS
jgi:hypothetical protein